VTDPDATRPERVLSSRRLYEGRILNLRVDTVELPGGGEATREIVEHAEVAATVPLDDDGTVTLVRQYRLAVGQALLEVPAGLVHPGEPLLEAARRELEEETGLRAARLRHLVSFYVSPGFTDERVHLFLAQGLSQGHPQNAADERIQVVRLPLRQALALVERGDVQDAKSVIGLLLAARETGLIVERRGTD
jgi:ADP-ribose pyrophosphatase